MALTTGYELKNRYRIVKLLGQGGFGAVYRAWDLNLERPCAIKENLSIGEYAQSQFRREAIILAKLSHPNLPQVIDHFIIPGQGQYLVMEFIEGQDLQQKLDENKAGLPLEMVRPWFNQICDALAYLHAQNPPIIHRDIKPANIRITPQGKAVLVDFGIAKVLDPGVVTTEGARGVTAGFSPPEQYGQGKTTAQSDIYALGATFFYTLTYQSLPESIDLMLGSVEAPQKAHEINNQIPVEVSLALSQATQIEVTKRFKHVDQLKSAFLYETPKENQTDRIGQYQRFEPTVLIEPGNVETAPEIKQQAQRDFSSFEKWWKYGLAAILLAALLIGSLLTLTGFLLRSFLNPEKAQITAPAALSLPVEETAKMTASPAPMREMPTPAIVASQTPASPIPATPLPASLKDPFGMDMALVPAGSFNMGSNSNPEEQPIHQVTLSSFYMDVYEVTNANYRGCVNAGVCRAPRGDGGTFYDSEFNNHPVTYIDWNMAVQYCAWRGSRLPTEAEWEKAARGGLEGKLYPWGDIQPGCQDGAENGANYAACFKKGAIAVGTFDPNGYGLYDMVGNVWEWVQDWYAEKFYHTLPTHNPIGPAVGSTRGIRGGSFSDSEKIIRVSYRGHVDPLSYGSSRLGFRCVRDISEGQPSDASNTALAPSATPSSVRQEEWREGKLVFVQQEGRGTDLYILDLRTEALSLITRSESGLISGPVFSPDGERIVYSMAFSNDLFVIQAVSGAEPFKLGQCSGPSWSPDGQKIICSSNKRDQFSVLDVATGRLIKNIPLPCNAYAPSWSNARDEIAFACFDNNTTMVNLIPLDMSDYRELANVASENYVPVFSPNGQWIAYQSNLSSSLSEIWMVDRSGGNTRRITFTPNNAWSRAPAWSPDGKWLAFVSSQAGSVGADYGEIFVISVSTGDLFQVSRTGGKIYDWRVNWSP